MPNDESGDDLQFTRLELDAPTDSELRCSQFDTPIDGDYYLVNGQVVSSEAKESLAAAAEVTSGGPARMTKAVLFGAGAALLGSLLYFLVSWLTGYEVGLISIVVGIMVGKAVHMGSGNRGGVKYQVLAVALTYLSIVSSFVPLVFMELADMAEQEQSEAAIASSDEALAPGADTAESSPVERDALSPSLEVGAESEEIGAFDYLMLVGLLLALPFLSGFENILGLAIIAFGLWEAWKNAARTEFVIEGPFDSRETEPAEPA